MLKFIIVAVAITTAFSQSCGTYSAMGVKNTGSVIDGSGLSKCISLEGEKICCSSFAKHQEAFDKEYAYMEETRNKRIELYKARLEEVRGNVDAIAEIINKSEEFMFWYYLVFKPARRSLSEMADDKLFQSL